MHYTESLEKCQVMKVEYRKKVLKNTSFLFSSITRFIFKKKLYLIRNLQ